MSSVPLSVVQEGHKLSVTGGGVGGGGRLQPPRGGAHRVRRDRGDLGPGRHLLPRHDQVPLLPPHQRPRGHHHHQVPTSTRHASDVLWMSNIADMSACSGRVYNLGIVALRPVT